MELTCPVTVTRASLLVGQGATHTNPTAALQSFWLVPGVVDATTGQKLTGMYERGMIAWLIILNYKDTRYSTKRGENDEKD